MLEVEEFFFSCEGTPMLILRSLEWIRNSLVTFLLFFFTNKLILLFVFAIP